MNTEKLELVEPTNEAINGFIVRVGDSNVFYVEKDNLYRDGNMLIFNNKYYKKSHVGEWEHYFYYGAIEKETKIIAIRDFNILEMLDAPSWVNKSYKNAKKEYKNYKEEIKEVKEIKKEKCDKSFLGKMANKIFNIKE